jgi:hypothetical protein
VLLVLSWIKPVVVLANPYFFIEGTSSGGFKLNQSWKVGLHTGGSTVTAAQTVVHFDGELFNPVFISTLDTRCSFWAPADPALNFGSGGTPYFHDGDKIVISCGFRNPGLISTSSAGDLILSFMLEPYYLGTATFSFSDSAFRYIGNTVIPGIDIPFEYLVTATFAASPSPTPVPSPTPPIPTPDTLSLDDLEIVDWSSTGTYSGYSGGYYGSTYSGLLTETGQVSTFDDTIPPPPADLESRAAATPRPLLGDDETKDEGAVLSIQSLRELLIPGKSDADRRLVIFNLFMMLLFVILLAVLVWRLLLLKRSNKQKAIKMSEILEGELSVIETKVQAVKAGTTSSDEVVKSIEALKKNLEKKT